MSGQRISAQEVMSETFAILWREKELLGLLLVLATIFTLLFFWPFLKFYAALLTNFSLTESMNQDALQQLFGEADLETGAIYFAVLALPFTVIYYGIFAVWSRACVLGKARAMEGGLQALVKRTLWAFWRYICTFGWMLLMVSALVLVAALFGFLSSSLGVSSGGAGAIFGLVVFLVIISLYVAFFIAVMGLMVLSAISIHGEARDFRLPIHKSFGLMRGNILRAAGLLIALIFIYEIILSFVFVIFLGLLQAGSDWLVILALFFMFAAGSLFNFGFMTYGAVYASRVVPELKR